MVDRPAAERGSGSTAAGIELTPASAGVGGGSDLEALGDGDALSPVPSDSGAGDEFAGEMRFLRADDGADDGSGDMAVKLGVID